MMVLLLLTHTMFDNLGLVSWPRVCQKHKLQILSCSTLVRSTLNILFVFTYMNMIMNSTALCAPWSCI